MWAFVGICKKKTSFGKKNILKSLCKFKIFGLDGPWKTIPKMSSFVAPIVLRKIFPGRPLKISLKIPCFVGTWKNVPLKVSFEAFLVK